MKKNEYKVSHIYIYYPRNFGNEYSLIEVDTRAECNQLYDWYKNNGRAGDDLHRITRKTLSALNARENFRRKYNRSFSGHCMTEPMSAKEFLGYCNFQAA